MKKALTIYIDDDETLLYVCGAFISMNDNPELLTNTTLLNEKIPKNVIGFYLPRTKNVGVRETQWIREEQKYDDRHGSEG